MVERPEAYNPAYFATHVAEWWAATMFSEALFKRSAIVATAVSVLCALFTPCAIAQGWITTGNLTVARNSHSATLLQNGTVLVAGGYGNGNAPVSATELYNPSTRTWSNIVSMSTARDGHTATLLPNGKVLVAGGYDGTGSIASAEIYDPSADSWSLAVPLLQRVASIQQRFERWPHVRSRWRRYWL